MVSWPIKVQNEVREKLWSLFYYIMMRFFVFKITAISEEPDCVVILYAQFTKKGKTKHNCSLYCLIWYWLYQMLRLFSLTFSRKLRLETVLGACQTKANIRCTLLPFQSHYLFEMWCLFSIKAAPGRPEHRAILCRRFHTADMSTLVVAAYRSHRQSWLPLLSSLQNKNFKLCQAKSSSVKKTHSITWITTIAYWLFIMYIFIVWVCACVCV